MVMNFISYKLCKLFVRLMRFQKLFVCINHFPQFTPFLLDLFKSVKEGFYCTWELSVHILQEVFQLATWVVLYDQGLVWGSHHETPVVVYGLWE
jgi:hypothetical protein